MDIAPIPSPRPSSPLYVAPVDPVLSGLKQTLERMKNQNHFALLGVAAAASLDELKAAYVKLARQWHPDTVSADASSAPVRAVTADLFALVGEAFHVLADPTSRAQYEAGLEADASRPAARPGTILLR